MNFSPRGIQPVKALFATIASTVVLLSGCATPPSAETRAPQRIVLLVDEIKAIRNFPVVVAERLGYLRSDEFVVTVMNIRDDTPTAQMLMDGRVDAVMAYYHHNVVNRSEGHDTQAIVTLGVTPGAKVLVANAARSRYRSVADLKGSRIIAGGAGSSKTTLANALMLAGGLQIGDYTRIVNESPARIVDSLKAGDADLVVAPTPDGDFYEAAGVATVFADLTTLEGTKRSLGTAFPSATVYMSADGVRDHPDRARFLAGAFVRTLQWIHAHSAEQVAAMIPSTISGKDREVYLRMLDAEIPMFASDGRMPPDGARHEWAVLSAFNPRYGAIRVEDTYTNRFVDEVLAGTDAAPHASVARQP